VRKAIIRKKIDRNSRTRMTARSTRAIQDMNLKDRYKHGWWQCYS